VSTEGQGTLTVAALRKTRVHRQEVLQRALPVAVIVVVITAQRANPGPGWSGIHLGIALSMLGLVVAAVAGIRFQEPRSARVAVVGLLLASSVALMWLQPNGPGTIGLVLAVAFGTRLVTGRLAVALSAAAAGAILLLVILQGTGVYAKSSALGVPGVVAVASLLITTVFGRRIQVQDAQADQMLLELEQTRGAELRAAALAERQRLAREMHDVLAHSLSGLVMNLEGARLLAASDPADPRLADTIDRAHHLARSGLNEARRAISVLRDDELPGPEGIETMTAEFARDSGIPCRFAVTGPRRDVSSETQLALYRVAQEALTNIRKHAHPDRAEVALAYEPRAVTLTVEDIETDPAADRPEATVAPSALNGGYGLTGMRERAELLGGTLTACPTGHGFRVELRVPA
jgi:signal transduction histidine kinase